MYKIYIAIEKIINILIPVSAMHGVFTRCPSMFSCSALVSSVWQMFVSSSSSGIVSSCNI